MAIGTTIRNNLLITTCFYFNNFLILVIYSLKMYLFRGQLTKTHSASYIKKLRRFVIFCTYCYLPYWFNSPIAAKAPSMDLKFYFEMLDFPDDDIREAVLEKILRHTWYAIT